MNRRKGANAGADVANQNAQSEGELRNLLEEVQRIRMRTLYEMVNEVQVTTRAGPRTKNVVWLTSPQVHMFQKDTLQRLLQALEIKRAPNLVIMVKPSLYCKAMIKNSGQRFSTRVKFGVRQYDIELLDGSAVSTPSQTGLRIRTKGPARSMSGVSTEGQLLGCSHDGSSSTVLADTPVVDEDLLDKLVAPNREDMEETDRKICMYVSEVLMPIIVNTSAIVITYGTNNCSFTVALGEAFNKLPVNAQVGTPGFNCPRLLGIVSFPNVAASAIRPGNNAHGILEATQQEEAARAMLPHSLSSSCFVDEDYQEFLKKVNGADKEDWMQYDLVPGLTDVIMVDSRNPEMDCQDKTPVRHLVATFERVFAGTIPTLSIFYGAASGRLDYHGIISALSQGVSCLVLDTRRRPKRGEHGVPIAHAIEDLEAFYRRTWEQGAAETHRNATLAYIIRAISERPVQQGSNEDGVSWISDVISSMEKRKRALQEEVGPGKRGSPQEAGGNKYQVNEEDGTSLEMITLDEVVTAVVNIMRANDFIVHQLHNMYADFDPDQKTSDSEKVVADPEYQNLVKLPIKDLAERNGASRSGLWLRLYTLLKPVWTNEPTQLFTGSLIGGSAGKMLQTLEARLSLAGRLPDQNTLEEMYALREAWDDCDRYQTMGLQARFEAKWSYILLLVFGVATVVVATFHGAGVFPNSTEAPVDGLMASTGDLVAFIVALLSSITASIIAYFDPVKRWENLRAASLKLRSHIVMFRTRSLLYDLQGSIKASELLRRTVESLRDQTLAQAGISATTFFQNDGKTMFRHGQYVSHRPPVTKAESFKRPGGPETVSISPEFHNLPVIDDYHSPMNADAFISLRLEPTIRYYQSRISPLYNRKTACAMFLMLSTAACTLMASAGLTVWIAIVSVVATSVNSFAEFSSYGKKLRRYGKAITKLRDIRLWWETLPSMEQASTINVNGLIERTEAVIMGNTNAWLQTSLASKSLGKAVGAAKGEPDGGNEQQ